MKTDIKMKMLGRSHKVIEKRRRDRINQCLEDLSRSVPSVRSKQNSGKLEKAEILEMTVDYLKTFPASNRLVDHDINGGNTGRGSSDALYNYRSGYIECMQQIQQFWRENLGYHGNIPHKMARLMDHLQTTLHASGPIMRRPQPMVAPQAVVTRTEGPSSGLALPVCQTGAFPCQPVPLPQCPDLYRRDLNRLAYIRL